MALIDSLSSYYKLEEASGARVDEQGAVNLTLSGTLGRRLMKIGYGVDFVDSSAYLYRASSEAVRWEGTRERSISLWVEFDSISGVDTILSRWSNGGSIQDYILYRNGNKLYLGARQAGAAVVSSVTVSVGVKYHVVLLLRSNNTVSMYINNALQGNGNGGQLAGTASEFRLGQNSATNLLDGGIDELGLWGRILTTTEIADLYNFGDGFAYPFTVIPPVSPYNGNMLLCFR